MTQPLRKDSAVPVNIYEEISKVFTTSYVRRLSNISGDSPNAVRSLIDASTPSVLAAIILLNSSPNGRVKWEKLAADPRGLPPVDELVAAITTGLGDLEAVSVAGQELCRTIFGARLQQTLETLSRVTGIRIHSVTSLLSLMAPTIIGSLRAVAASHGLSTGAVAEILSSQVPTIRKLLPGPLPHLLGTATQEIPRRAPIVPVRKKRQLKPSWWWGSFIPVSLLLLWYFW